MKVQKFSKFLISAVCCLLLFACQNTSVNDGNINTRTQDEMPVYTIVENGLNGENLRTLFEVLEVEFDEQISQVDNLNQALLFLDNENFMDIPSQVVAKGKSEEGEGETVIEEFDFAKLQEVEPIDGKVAIELAEDALSQAGMLPNDLPLPEGLAVESRSDHSVFEAFSADGKEIVSARLDTHVLFDLSLSINKQPVPLTGPGAKLKMVFDGEGRATQVFYSVQGLEEAGSVSVLSESEALKACQSAYKEQEGEITRQSIGALQIEASAQLVYHVPAFESKARKLFPSYMCSGNLQTKEGEVQLRHVLVNAETGKVLTQSSNQATIARPNEVQDISTQRLGRVDVGLEWIGTSQGLGGSQNNAGGFDSTMRNRGIPVEFNWGDFNAWERDFKDPSKGGNDNAWVDNVDMVFYTGHANGDGFTFPGNNDDGFLHYSEAYWGNRDLEWLVVAACGPLQRTSSGLAWWQRWGPAFGGLHQLLAYANVSWDNTSEGRLIAEYLLGKRINLGIVTITLPPMKVRQAWVATATEVQPSSVTWSVMGPSSGSTSNYNDYFWGKGPVGADIPNPTGFWRISGPS